MKNLRFHLIYLAIIGFLTYQYWTKAQALDEAVRSIEGFDKVLKTNTKVVDMASVMIKNDIDKHVMAYPTQIQIAFQNKAINAIRAFYSINRWLEKQKNDFIILSGGFDKRDSSILVNRLSSKANNQFFSGLKIKQIQDSLAYYQNILNNISDKNVLTELQSYYTLPILLKNNIYWQSLKDKTNADILAQIAFIQNLMVLDEIYYLYYLDNMVAGDTEMKFDAFKVAITPQKSALIQGQTFKADIYLAQFSSNPGSNVTFTVNEKEIPFYAGVAHFEKVEQTPGLKTVKATAIVKNPLTGQISHYLGSFEYEVLPKCAKNCQ